MQNVNYDYIIIGQGIAGTMLSWFLKKAGQEVLVYDDAQSNSSSKVAAGIINPVSGRKFETAWLYDTIFPFAEKTYHEMEEALGIVCFHERLIHNIWSSQQMEDAFNESLKTNPWLLEPAFVKGANIQLNALLPAWRKKLNVKEERFDATQITITSTHIEYQNIKAKAVIFCEGAQSPANPYWRKLKFLPNKGEALIIHAPELQTNNIIKKGNITIVPMGEDLYWAGATFSWDYTDALPTESAKESIAQSLKNIPHKIIDHIAAIRPSGPDRRPLVGMHPHQPGIGIFNGMGSKGCSLAPWTADQFVKHLLEATPLKPEIDIKRYFNALR
nr:FAD-binding oxidoreductase [Chitinophaga sp. SYP-B3965]